MLIVDIKEKIKRAHYKCHGAWCHEPHEAGQLGGTNVAGIFIVRVPSPAQPSGIVRMLILDNRKVIVETFGHHKGPHRRREFVCSRSVDAAVKFANAIISEWVMDHLSTQDYVIEPKMPKGTKPLSPCPFCGATPGLYFKNMGGGPPPKMAIICEGCGTHGPGGYGSSRGDWTGALADAVTSWNRRV